MKRIAIAVATLAVIAIAGVAYRHSQHPDIAAYLKWMKGAEAERARLTSEVKAYDARKALDEAAKSQINLDVTCAGEAYDKQVPAECLILDTRYHAMLSMLIDADGTHNAAKMKAFDEQSKKTGRNLDTLMAGGTPSETSKDLVDAEEDDYQGRMQSAAAGVEQALSEVCDRYGLVKEFEVSKQFSPGFFLTTQTH